MSEDIKPEVIKKTQESLSKYIKRPPLTEKLLKKPPFRFIHDIITSIMKETGFFEGIFTPEELNSENIKDRDSKIAFLEKVIKGVKSSGISVSVRPSKIVAGLEVNKTNELLQAIGKALDLKVKADNKDLGEAKKSKERKSSTSENQRISRSPQVNENLKKSKAKAGSNESLARKAKSRKDSIPENKINIDDNNKEKNKSAEEKRKEKNEKDKYESRSRKSKEKLEEVVAKEREDKTNEEINNIFNGEVKSNEANDKEDKLAELELEHKQEVSQSQNSIPIEQRVGSAQPKVVTGIEVSSKNTAGSDDTVAELGNHTQRPKTSKPLSARKERIVSSRMNIQQPSEEKNEVKIKESEEELEKEELIILGGLPSQSQLPKMPQLTSAKRPPSARPGAPRLRDRGEVAQMDKNSGAGALEIKPVAVIEDTNFSQDDDKENMVVVETQPLHLDAEEDMNEIISKDIPMKEEGALVSKILETKKEIEDGPEDFPWKGSSQTQHVEIDWESGNKLKRDAWKKEVDHMCEGIQQLTRATNPLGKLFDFLQEDIDSMQKELQSFAQLNSALAKELRHEQRLTGDSLEGLKRQLAEVESLIEAEREAVRYIKANIIENEKKIIKLVTKPPDDIYEGHDSDSDYTDEDDNDNKHQHHSSDDKE